ncbi:hypothetical protein QSI21_23945, partial [Enterobacter hormaechei]|uniref:hypothetical protein n=1 Tax=Enterobacter hormaechei TaxID=158836 RepID=UPI00256EA7F7
MHGIPEHHERGGRAGARARARVVGGHHPQRGERARRDQQIERLELLPIGPELDIGDAADG